MQHKRRRDGFTLIELLIVIAIIAILAVVVVLVLNPSELMKQGRDSNRLSDLNTLTNAISVYQADGQGSLGAADTVYVSIPDPTATTTAGDQCQGLSLAALPSPWVYHCPASSTAAAVNGTGWLPLNFSKISSGNPLPSLPEDPTDAASSCLFYTYETNGTQYELTAALESQKYGSGGTQSQTAGDGGQYADMYEKGTSLTLLPIDIVSSTPSCASIANVASGTSGGPVTYGLAYSTPINVSSTNGTPINLTFPGTAGVPVAIAGTYESGVYWSGNGATISIVDPSGHTIASSITGYGPYEVATTTPTTGTYTFNITMPSGVGAATFTLTQPTTTSMTLGTPLSYSVLPGQTSNVTFTGTAGNNISIAASNQSGVFWSGNGSAWSITEPDGVTTLWSGWTGTGPMMMTSTLPQNGTYVMHLTTSVGGGTGGAGGSVQFTYSQLATNTMTINSMLAVSTTLAGQMQNITFSGAAGQNIIAAATAQNGVYWSGNGTPMTLVSPSGTAMWTMNTGISPLLITSTLPTTGTYTFQIRPPTSQGGYTGNMSIALSQATSTTITAGTPYSTSVSIAGQYVDLLYSGTAGQTVSVQASGQSGVYWSGSGSPFYLISPTGTIMASGWTGTGSYSIASTTLPVTGTYTVELRPVVSQSWTGASTFTLSSS